MVESDCDLIKSDLKKAATYTTTVSVLNVLYFSAYSLYFALFFTASHTPRARYFLCLSLERRGRVVALCNFVQLSV